MILQESIDDIQRFALDYLSALCTHIIPQGIACSIVTERGTPLGVIDTQLRQDDLLVTA